LPYLEQTYKKYQGRDVEFVSINIIPGEDGMVKPMWNKLGITFPSLKAPDEEWPRTQYNVFSAPTNFLLDPDGRVVFRPRAESRDEQKQLEIILDALLAHKEKARRDKKKANR
jgi:hypothetical protein